MPFTVAPSTLSWACLNVLTKKRFDVLMEHYGGLDEAWNHLSQELLRQLGCREDSALKILNEAEELNLSEHESVMNKQNIQLLSILDDAYPDALREIADPPVFLFARGNIDLLGQPTIAIVGTRAMSTYGKRVVEHLVPDIVRAGIVTVSGLAMGVDAEVAKQTMHAGGQTIAVLGHGLGAIYPKVNAKLAESIIENEGLLLTEYPLHIRPDKFTFPARNRIIAGMSIGTIVAEAASQSGSLITASLALEYGRDVFAIPGQIFDPNMAGTHHLIQKSGAKLITCADDVLLELGVVTPEKKESLYKAQTPNEKILFDILSSMPQSVDDLTGKSGLSVAETNATLTLIELKGGARNVGMGQWVKA